MDLESQDAKPLEMRSPGCLIGENLIGMLTIEAAFVTLAEKQAAALVVVGDAFFSSGRCFDHLLWLPRNPPLTSMKWAISSTPCPPRRLLKTNGRVPRLRLSSRSMT